MKPSVIKKIIFLYEKKDYFLIQQIIINLNLTHMLIIFAHILVKSQSNHLED